MSTAFQAIGMVTTVGICLFVICIIKELLEDKIKRAKWQYKYKHRFDKPPLAKCYCKDCIYCADGCCMSFDGMRVWENWFCWQASPTKYDLNEKDEVQDGKID